MVMMYTCYGNVSSLQRIFISNEFLNEGTLKKSLIEFSL